MKSREKKRLKNVRRTRKHNYRQRRHVLDVKVSSRKAVQVRRTVFFRVGMKLAFFTLLIMGVFFLGKLSFAKIFYQNPDFNLSEISIETNGKLSFQEILKEAGVKEGDNLFSLDLDVIKEKLARLPKVASVKTYKEFPDKLVIEISERAPVARLVYPDEMETVDSSEGEYLVDNDGYVFVCQDFVKEYDLLPTLRGDKTFLVKPGSKITSPRITAALHILRLSQSIENYGMYVVNVDMEKEYAIDVYYSNEMHVTYGMEDLEEQVETLHHILDHSEKLQKEIRQINLLVKKNIPVIYRED